MGPGAADGPSPDACDVRGTYDHLYMIDDTYYYQQESAVSICVYRGTFAVKVSISGICQRRQPRSVLRHLQLALYRVDSEGGRTIPAGLDQAE